MASKTSDLVFNLIGHDKTGPAFKSAAGNADHLGRSVRDVDDSMERLSRWGKTGALALGTGFVIAGAAAAKFGVAAVSAASDFSEVSSAIEQTFGAQSAAELQAWAKTASSSLGQSKTQALDAAKTFGVFGKAAGLTGPALTGFSTDLTELATDLASFSNTTPEQAIEALGAGLRGESEPLRAYGVLLDDAALKARAMQMGIYDGTGALTQQQRVLAAQAEILAQTSLQQGDFARTSGGMANQLRETSARFADIKTTAGAALIPIVEQYLPMLNDGLADFATWIEGNIPAIQATMTGWADKVIELYPQVAAQVGEIATGVQDNWPEIVDTAKTLGGALENVGKMAETMFSAFRALPPELQTFIGTVALLQKTGVLTIGFKAADIVKDLFRSTVPVMNVGVLNAGAGGGGTPTGSPVGNALRIAGGGSLLAGGASVALGAAGIGVGGLFATYHAQLKAALDDGGSTVGRFGTSFYDAGKKAKVADGEVATFGVTTMQTGEYANRAGQANRDMGAAIGLAGEHSNLASQSTQVLASTIGQAGTAAGLTQQQLGIMSAAAMAVPPGASVDQLANAIRDAGVAAGVTTEQADAMAAAAYAIPGSANLPALSAAITDAGRSGVWTTEQTNAMSAAVSAIPPGATAEQMGEAIRVAGVKAGLTDQQIQGVTAAANNVPPVTEANVTTDAPAAKSQILDLAGVLDAIERTRRIGIEMSFSAAPYGPGIPNGGGGAATFSGTGSVGGWLEDAASEIARSLAPQLAAPGGAYAGPGTGILGRPLSDYVVSSEFGPRGGAMHYGIDLAAPMGTGVFASAPGLITQSGWNGGYGNFIAMDHGLGIVTRYGHMSNLIAGAGQVVGQGALIGQVGSTGDSTGPHLHFETQVGGNFVNPRTMVALRHGGLVPTALSRGEYYVPREKAKGNYALLSAANAGVLSGPGTSTSDSIRALTRGGDFIVNAAATRRHRALLDSVVKGPRRMATGGVVGGTVTGGSISERVVVQVLLDGRQMHEAQVRYLRDAGVSA